MGYKQFALQPNHQSRRPDRLLFLDIETRTKRSGSNKELWFKLAVTRYLRLTKKSRDKPTEEKLFLNPQKLIHYIISKTIKSKPLYVITHNAQFDIWVSQILPYFVVEKWERTFFYENQLTFILSVKRDEKRIKILSTTNWFPFSLKECGKMLGLFKKEVDFQNVSYDKLIDYCKRDVYICERIFRAYIDFINTHDLGNFASTRPSQAMSSFRHRFMSHNIFIHQEEKVQELEQNCYFGGRCEIWEQGDLQAGPFVSGDINSMYPYVMKKYEYPCCLKWYREDLDLGLVNSIISNFLVCSFCKVKTSEPLFPIKGKDKIIYPIGTFYCYLCSTSFTYAFEHNMIEKIYNIAIYDKNPLFVNYVDYFYRLKLKYKRENNKIMESLCKIFLNSFYGKWAQQIPELLEWKENDNETSRETVIIEGLSKPVIQYKFLGKVTVEKGKHPGSKTFTAIAAHVTDNARFELNKLIKIIGFNHILSVDTDSLKFRYTRLNAIKDYFSQSELGLLKFEGCTNRFYIGAPKDYKWGGKEKIKGVKKDSLKLKEGQYIGERFLKTKTLLKQGIIDHVNIVKAPKMLKREYKGGKLGEYGRFIPYELPQDYSLIY